MATIQSEAFFVELAESPFTTWKKVVCETDSSASFESSTNSVLTKCGTFATDGEQTATVEYNGVVKSDPATDELSYEQMLSYWKAGTALRIRRENPAGGANIYQVMDGAVTSLSDASAAGELVTFSFTFTCTDTSTIDFTA